MLSDLQITACPCTEIRLFLQQRLGVQGYRGNGVVDVVRNSASHLSQRPQSLLLHHALLAVAEVVVGLLQSAIQVGLVRSQRHVLAQVTDEFAVRTAKAVRSVTSG